LSSALLRTLLVTATEGSASPLDAVLEVSALLEDDEELKLRPDGIPEIDFDGDGILDITGNRHGTLTISKPITDPATGVKTKGASMTTTHKAP
jgi:hypothetical protein